MNGDPFELALALVRLWISCAGDLWNIDLAENFIYVKQLAQLSPETKVFSNLEPTMLYYDPEKSPA